MNHSQPIPIQPTGIPSFDELLNGGIPVGSTLLAAGPSGAGKTMFCSHWLFAGYKQFNEPGLYISLTEPISKLLHHQSANAYFDQAAIDNQSIQFKDLRILLEHDNLDSGVISKEDINQIIDNIGRMVLEAGAKRVVLDSVTAMCYRLDSPDLIRHFIFTLGTTLAYLDATVILTSEVTGAGVSIFGVEEFISDGIFKFDYTPNGERTFRIVKLRGHSYDSEATKFSITSSGIRLYPIAKQVLEHSVSSQRFSSGITGLDTMLHGGFMEGSCIEIKGPSGSGKTIISHHCVAEALQDSYKVLHISFEQSIDEIRSTVNGFGWDTSTFEDSGMLKNVCLVPEDHYISEHIHNLQEAIDAEKYTVVVIDSIYALARYFDTAELYDALNRFVSFCKNRGVTLIVTNSTGSMIDAQANAENVIDISSLADTIIRLRFIEVDSTLRHGVFIIKMRNSEHVKRMMELSFTSHGALITDGFSGYENLMSGTAHKASSSEQDKLYSLFLEEFGAEGEALFNEQKEVGLQFEQIEAFTQSLVNAGIHSPEEHVSFMNRVKDIF